jgi:single-stranded-DNA-specific exonuclease
MQKYDWIFHKSEKLAEAEYPAFFRQILASRGLYTAEEIDRFLNPDYVRDLHDARLLLNAEKAAARIWQAVERSERVVVYSDYDADGISSAVLMTEFLKDCGLSPHVHMPDRRTEGHGLHLEAVQEFMEQKAQLLIVLDCGVTNHAEIDQAQRNGMDVVVIEHHQVVESVPKAYALVNPHQRGCTYPFRSLCAAGVTFKVLQLLAPHAVKKGAWEEGHEKWCLDLVALATVADMMPLIGENRALVKYGLFVMAQTRRVGLRELFRVARIDPTFNRETLRTNINSITVGFSLSPRINAASRMSHAALAYNLLTSPNVADARLLALELEDHNSERRREIDFLIKELDRRLRGKEIPPFIVEGGEAWPVSLLGLVANRLMDRLDRPVMLIDKSSTVYKASLRAPEGFDLMAALASVSPLLIQYGGHTAAGGCSFEPAQEELIKEGLVRYAAEHRGLSVAACPALQVDAEVTVPELTDEHAALVEQLAPFGMGNEIPRLLITDLELVRVRSLGASGKHAKLYFRDEEGREASVLFFFHNGGLEHLIEGRRYDLVGELSLNEWQGRQEAQFKLIDIRDAVAVPVAKKAAAEHHA